MKYSIRELENIHKHSIRNQSELSCSPVCGCFHCGRIFGFKDIKDFITEPENSGKTAICPYCGIDSVIGSASGYGITSEFLKELYKYWFNIE